MRHLELNDERVENRAGGMSFKLWQKPRIWGWFRKDKREPEKRLREPCIQMPGRIKGMSRQVCEQQFT